LKVGDIVRSTLPFPRKYILGVVLDITPLTSKENRAAAEIYWDDGNIRGTMIKYLEIICE